MKCPIREVCPGYDFVDEGTGYTILGFADTDTFMSKTAIKVKLDDGRVGYFEEFDLLSRYNTLQGEEKAQDRCRKLPSIRIGATPAEVRQSKWGDPYDRHTTETAAHVREQWVYKFGPSCQGERTTKQERRHEVPLLRGRKAGNHPEVTRARPD